MLKFGLLATFILACIKIIVPTLIPGLTWTLVFVPALIGLAVALVFVAIAVAITIAAQR